VVFALALAAIVAAIAPYVYEQPHHHCPFCILEREYGHVGFALYLPLFLATGAGIASSVLAVIGSGSAAVASSEATRRLARTAVVCHLLFAAVALALVMTSRLSLLA
jgi:preprotein translocase subunit SecG